MSPLPKPSAEFRLLLYVVDDTQNSMVAVANLKALCEAHLAGRHVIEIVDVFKEPARALADHIYMTPTLVRLAPSPERRIVGTLKEKDMVLQALGFERKPE